MRHALQLPFKQFSSALGLPLSFFTSSRVYLHTGIGVSASSTEISGEPEESCTDAAASKTTETQVNLSAAERVRLLPAKEPSKWLKFLQLPKTPSPAFEAIYAQLCRSPNNADTLLSFWKSHPTLFSCGQIDTLFAYYREHRVPVTNSRVFSLLLPLVNHLPDILDQWIDDLSSWLNIKPSKLSIIFDRLNHLKQSKASPQQMEKVLHAEVDLLLDPSTSSSFLYARKLFSSYTAETRPAPHSAISITDDVVQLILHSPKIAKNPAEDLFTLSKTLNTAISQSHFSAQEISEVQQTRLRQSFSDKFALALVKAPQPTMNENHIEKQDAAYATADDYAMSILRHALSTSIPIEDYPVLLKDVLSSGYRINTACYLLQAILEYSPPPHTTFEPALNTLCHFLMRRKQPGRILHLLAIYNSPFSNRLIGRKLQALLALKRKTDVQGYIRSLDVIPVQGIIALIHSFRGDRAQLLKLHEYWLERSGEREEWVQRALVEGLMVCLEKEGAGQVDGIHQQVRLSQNAEEAIALALSFPEDGQREKRFATVLRVLSLCLSQGLTELACDFLLHQQFPAQYLTPRIIKRTIVSAAKHHPHSWHVMEQCLKLCAKVDSPHEVFGRAVGL